MFETKELGLFLIALVGVLIVSFGISLWHESIKCHKADYILYGEVLDTKHVEKTQDDALILFHDKTRVKYAIGEKVFIKEIETTSGYAKGDRIPLIFKDKKISEYHWRSPSLGAGIWTTLAGGAMIVFAVLYYMISEVAASYDLCAALLFGGLAVLSAVRHTRKATQNALKIEGTISRILVYVNDRNPRRQILRTSDTYYPIIRYTDESGNTREYLSQYSANSSGAFKVGREKTLYRDPQSGCLFEQVSQTGYLVIAIALIGIALFGLMTNLLA